MKENPKARMVDQIIETAKQVQAVANTSPDKVSTTWNARQSDMYSAKIDNQDWSIIFTNGQNKMVTVKNGAFHNIPTDNSGEYIQQGELENKLFQQDLEVLVQIHTVLQSFLQ